MQHIAEPIVEIAPADARRLQLREGELARIWSRNGVMVAKTVVSRGQRPGSLFVPMHWNNQFARRGRVNDLLSAVRIPGPDSRKANRWRWRLHPGVPPGTVNYFVASRFRCRSRSTGVGGPRWR